MGPVTICLYIVELSKYCLMEVAPHFRPFRIQRRQQSNMNAILFDIGGVVIRDRGLKEQVQSPSPRFQEISFGPCSTQRYYLPAAARKAGSPAGWTWPLGWASPCRRTAWLSYGIQPVSQRELK